MSLASQYAERVAQIIASPTFRSHALPDGDQDHGELQWFACVSAKGDLSLRGLLPANKALELAAWIIATFAEPNQMNEILGNFGGAGD